MGEGKDSVDDLVVNQKERENNKERDNSNWGVDSGWE
jgi:hypothetical protein